jgi:hypothetical protein
MNVRTTGFITASIGMLWTRSWRQIYLAKSENRIPPKRESGSHEIGKTAFDIKKQENTTENTHKKNDDDDQSKLHAQLPPKHPVVVVASSWPGDDEDPTEIVEKLTEKLKLSYDQSKTVQFYLDQDGKGYVLEKVRITRSKDLRNAGGFFIRALEKDYRERSQIQSHLLLLKRNELSRSLRSHQRRTKSASKPVRNCENSSKRFGHPAETFFYGVTT